MELLHIQKDIIHQLQVHILMLRVEIHMHQVIMHMQKDFLQKQIIKVNMHQDNIMFVIKTIQILVIVVILYYLLYMLCLHRTLTPSVSRYLLGE